MLVKKGFQASKIFSGPDCCELNHNKWAIKPDAPAPRCLKNQRRRVILQLFTLCFLILAPTSSVERCFNFRNANLLQHARTFFLNPKKETQWSTTYLATNRKEALRNIFKDNNKIYLRFEFPETLIAAIIVTTVVLAINQVDIMVKIHVQLLERRWAAMGCY